MSHRRTGTMGVGQHAGIFIKLMHGVPTLYLTIMILYMGPITLLVSRPLYLMIYYEIVKAKFSRTCYFVSTLLCMANHKLVKRWKDILVVNIIRICASYVVYNKENT